MKTLLLAQSATASSQRQYVLGDAPAHWRICREEPVFAGKVTCGVRNETSGQSWPSNTVATDPFTGDPVRCTTAYKGAFRSCGGLGNRSLASTNSRLSWQAT